MATHVTHGGAVSKHPDQGHGQGHGHPPPFAQLPTPADVVEAATALDAFVAITIANVVEAAGALDAFNADVVAAGAVIPATVLEAAAASDLAAAVRLVAANAIEPAIALDSLAAAADVAAVVDEPAAALDELVAAVGAQILSGAVVEVATAVDQLDAAIVSVEVPIAAGGGGFILPSRPFPVEGYGFGILPQIEGEAHGVVGTVAKGAAQLLVHATAIGTCGQAGNASVVLGLSVASKGIVGARGVGSGTIMKFSGTATGRHDDDDAAVIAFLLAA